MKDRGTPISLFSFQDIVTSLTGIMVIIILVIVLQLAEAMYDYENPKSDNPEYHDLKGQIANLTQRIKDVREIGEEIPDEFKPYIEMSDELVDGQIQQTTKANAIMSDEKEKNGKEKETMMLSMQQLKDLLQALKDEKEQAEKAKRDVENKQNDFDNDQSLNDLAKSLETLKQENERLKNEIRIKADKLEITFQGVMSRQPILIECLGTSFRAQVYKGGEPVKEFNGGNLTVNLASLSLWLKEHDLKRCYPVLLWRRKAWPNRDIIILALSVLDKDMAMGQEPLDDMVKVF